MVVAFSLGAGIGSGLGYRMGSSQIAVYTSGVSQLPVSDPVTNSVTNPVSGDSTIALREQLDTHERVADDLLNQLMGLERRVVSLEATREAPQPVQATPPSEFVPAIVSRSEELQDQLQTAGFTDSEFDVISSMQDQLRLKRLQLRDKAIREGWFRTDDWSRQVRELDTDSELRKTLGDERFDDYLMATGQNNRVKVDELMAGSVAEQAGLVAGDLVYRYADLRVFSSGELRMLTTGGQLGENTALTVIRDGELVDLTVPRGPLGVMISGVALTDPDLN